MNESTLTQLKIIVERAVRPVRASTSRKRKMREELLAHVVGVFEEQAARLGDDRAALERTARRFGNPAEVMSQLQESVPARDAVRRFCEGRPGEPPWRTALRLAWMTGTFALAFVGFMFVVTSFAVGSVSVWPREALLRCLFAVLAVPVYLPGFVFLTHWMEIALDRPAGRSRLKVALVSVGSSLDTLLGLAAFGWPIWSANHDHLGAILFAVWVGCVVVAAAVWPHAFAQSSLLRRQYHEEWGRLPIEIPS
jgi:hypothetical protein